MQPNDLCLHHTASIVFYQIPYVYVLDRSNTDIYAGSKGRERT